MYINIKHNVMSLLFTSGDIDNRTKTIPKRLIAKSNEVEKQINEEYNIQLNKVDITKEFNNKQVRFAEMIPIVENSNTLIKGLALIDAFEEITEEMIKIPLSELKLYAYLYMTHKKLNNIDIILIFEDIEVRERIKKIFAFTYEEIEDFFNETMENYLKWIDLTTKWNKERNESIKPLKFPFKQYRVGQEKLAKGTYVTIAQNKKMFAQAPTGVGKTISTIFPSVKAVGENKIDKIFYLTAKTIGAKVAEESFDKMREQGLKFRNITLTAKDKVCFKGDAKCNPVSCEYARNYYGKLNNVILTMLENEYVFTREVIDDYARKNKLCPFELSLDLSLYADAVICDYNYVFDPNVYLKRYFSEGAQCNCTFLIDEAHNLVDRARNMYSAEINTKVLTNALEVCTGEFSGISTLILDVLKIINMYEQQCIRNEYSSVEFPSDLTDSIVKLSEQLSALFHRSKYTKSNDFNKLSDLYTMCNHFANISELYDDCYTFCIEQRESTILKLLCIDPSRNLKRGYEKGKSAIIFSATLSPLGYFKNILGGDKDSYGVMLDSPFDIKNREILVVDNISTKYKDREYSYDAIVEQINAVISCKTGNYMVFLPSFEYMNKVKERFNIKYPNIKTISQDNIMSELEREVYLFKFKSKPTQTMVSFNVISGIFSEGIDFKGDKLIGSIIVGVGLPMICLERNVIKDYFQQQNGYGFDFAYTFPGINRVVQAAGRVIRTENDKGIIMLIDDRFKTAKYRSLLPKEWSNHYNVHSPEQSKKIIEDFWNKP